MTATTPEVIPSAPQVARGRPRMQELGLLIVVVLLYAFFGVASHSLYSRGAWNPFLGLDNQINGISAKLSVYAIMAVGMTAVVITGGIDISVGAILAISGMSAGLVMQKMAVTTPWYLVLPVAFSVAMGVGGFFGFLNGLLIVITRQHPFIVTLGTLSVIRGLCFLYFPPHVPKPGKVLPDSLANVMRFRVGSDGLMLAPLIVMVVVAIAGWIFLQTTVAGRETYAIGGNVEAARYSGIRVWWATMRVYILMGVCCGVGAMVEIGRFGTSGINSGEGDELTVIAAAVVGGASLLGGRGTVLGALLGTLIMTALENGILTMQWNTDYTKVIIGTSIIVAVSLDSVSTYFVNRRSRART